MFFKNFNSYFKLQAILHPLKYRLLPIHWIDSQASLLGNDGILQDKVLIEQTQDDSVNYTPYDEIIAQEKVARVTCPDVRLITWSNAQIFANNSCVISGKKVFI